MGRDPSRAFALAGIATLIVAAAVGWQVLRPPWRAIQAERVTALRAALDVELAGERERFEQTRASLAYRRAEEARDAAAADLDADDVQRRIAELQRQLDELDVPSPAAGGHAGGDGGDALDRAARERSRRELVRLSGTPGADPERVAELERQLERGADLDATSPAGAPPTTPATTLPAEERRRDLEQQLRTLRAPLVAAEQELAAYRATLDALEQRRARLDRWEPGVREVLRPDGQAERCTTCHPGMDELASTHRSLGAASPYQGWGCTVCHGGNGRALEVDEAHRTLTLRPWTRGPEYTLEPLIDQLEHRDKTVRAEAAAALRTRTGRDLGFVYHAPADERAAAVARWRGWWAAARGYWRPPYPAGLAAFGHDASGRPERYAGAGSCLRCHEARQRRHVERWRATKFTSFARLDEVDDRTPCLACHTTGYDPDARVYVEPGVTCEGCHGPGAGYGAAMDAAVRMQAAGAVDEGERLLDDVSGELRARMDGDNVCVDCHDPFAVKELAFEHLM